MLVNRPCRPRRVQTKQYSERQKGHSQPLDDGEMLVASIDEQNPAVEQMQERQKLIRIHHLPMV